MDPREIPQPPERPNGGPHRPDPLKYGSGPNPYSHSEPLQPQPSSSDQQQPSPVQFNAAPTPRWWTPLAVCGLAFVALLATSSVLLAILVLVQGTTPTNVKEFVAAATSVSQSRSGLVILVAFPQIAMVSVPILAAILSPVPTRQRLGLVRGHWPLWTWIAAAAATPLVGMVSGVAIGMFMEESESLKEMSQLFRQHGASGFLVPLALLIGATPAICEELLFRGYVQTRLTRSFGPAAGILLASFMFALFHVDVVHVIAVFPMGLFLGWVSWRSGSLFPAILGHFVNNVISVVAVVLAPAAETNSLALPAMAFTLGILTAGVLGMAAVSIAAVLYGKPQPDQRLVGQSAAQMV